MSFGDGTRTHTRGGHGYPPTFVSVRQEGRRVPCPSAFGTGVYFCPYDNCTFGLSIFKKSAKALQFKTIGPTSGTRRYHFTNRFVRDGT